MITSTIGEDALFSTLIAISCYFVFHFYKSGKIQWALFFILVVGAGFRLYAGMDEYLHTWDERYHALVAKNMIQHPFKPMLYEKPLLPYDYRSWCCNHIWLNKPPLPFWLMSGSMSIFGISLWALRLPSFIFSMLGIFITFRIGALLFSKKTALIAAFLYAVGGKLIELAAGCDSSDHVETCHIVMFEVSVLWILMYWQKKATWILLLIGTSIGLTFLCKWTPSIFILFIWLAGSLWKKITFKQVIADSAIISVFAALVAFPWVWHIYKSFPEESKNIYTIITTANKNVIEGHAGEWYFYIDKIRILFGEIIYLPLIFTIWRVLRKKTYNSLSLIAIWIGLPLLFFSMAATKRDTYLMIMAPAFSLLIAFWARAFFIRYRNFRGYLLITLLLLLPLRYGVERSKIFTGRVRMPEWMHEIYILRQNLPYPAENTAVFNYAHNLELMFHTGVIAYPTGVDDETRQRLKKNGYKVLLYESGKLVEY